MAGPRRANGAGSIYIKHRSFYGRWTTADGGLANRKLGAVRRPGTREGLTRGQAEKRLRELMAAIQVTSDPERTITIAGQALLAHLEAKGCSKSHLETVESHLRVHLVPFFKDRALDRISEPQVTRLLVHLRRIGRKPKTIRNIASTLHSVFDLAMRRRWVTENPCKFVDLPAVPQTTEIRYLTQGELMAVLDDGIDDSPWALVERPLYLMAAMTGLRQGELLGLRWLDLDMQAFKVRVRQAYVRGEFKAPKSRRGSRGVPLAGRLVDALEQLAVTSKFRDDDDLVFGHPETGDPLDRSKVRKRFQRACRRAGVRVVRFHDLRHTFGTRVAASGEVSLRTLQEWMGHRDARTTLIYADYQPGEREAELVTRAFAT
jgi:integrase